MTTEDEEIRLLKQAHAAQMKAQEAEWEAHKAQLALEQAREQQERAKEEAKREAERKAEEERSKRFWEEHDAFMATLHPTAREIYREAGLFILNGGTGRGVLAELGPCEAELPEGSGCQS
ncbi:hypothetical protein [Ensifer aridi]|uniref:hypothetical protein n=1 Tax=Ensifer aridi TaxID=1708715 RepID=UPI000A10B617|nr:hypothetical protein [Ensifer aridi]